MALKLMQKDKSFLTNYQLFVSANLISSHMLSSQDQKIVQKMMAVCVNILGWEQYTISTSYIKICCFIVVSLLNFLLIGSSLHEMSSTYMWTRLHPSSTQKAFTGGLKVAHAQLWKTVKKTAKFFLSKFRNPSIMTAKSSAATIFFRLNPELNPH